MSRIKPRMAVAYHFFKDFDTAEAINDRIRKTCGGPLSLAKVNMVWNIIVLTSTDDRINTGIQGSQSTTLFICLYSETDMAVSAHHQPPISQAIKSCVC